ncbi:hypothetical protein OA92_03890 [Marinomonas sp. SBI22]|uniref:hypothetical protein n=1 Tax=unclassified Marinomonas TaxID=196814 RepID=UPI0007AF367E|nr:MULTISPECIES: hypothetical protein [unclassified Marinomonas]KZM45007.1 hypothetical protein OA92_03890 [Marinomonas sp. SBI22]KZM46706.1 hypothetical protein OA91_02950 [Marinomonas sp. SBI8L]
MGTKEVTAIAIKLLAIWLLINLVLYIPSLSLTISSLQSYNEKMLPQSLYFAMLASSIFIGSLASYLLFRTSNAVLRSLPEPTKENTTVISQQFLIQLAGAFFIVSALQSLPGVIIALNNQEVGIFYVLGSLFELGVGLYFFIKPTVWVHWFNILRGRA